MCIRTVGMAMLYIAAISFLPISVVFRLGRFRLCLVIVGGFGDGLGIVRLLLLVLFVEGCLETHVDVQRGH